MKCLYLRPEDFSLFRKLIFLLTDEVCALPGDCKLSSQFIGADSAGFAVKPEAAGYCGKKSCYKTYG